MIIISILWCCCQTLSGVLLYVKGSEQWLTLYEYSLWRVERVTRSINHSLGCFYFPGLKCQQSESETVRSLGSPHQVGWSCADLKLGIVTYLQSHNGEFVSARDQRRGDFCNQKCYIIRFLPFLQPNRNQDTDLATQRGAKLRNLKEWQETAGCTR